MLCQRRLSALHRRRTEAPSHSFPDLLPVLLASLLSNPNLKSANLAKIFSVTLSSFLLLFRRRLCCHCSVVRHYLTPQQPPLEPQDPKEAEAKLAMLRRGYAKQVKEVRNLYIHEMELLQIEKELKEKACRESLRVANEEHKNLKAEAAQIRALERKIAQSCLQLFDGHNGTAAAIYAKENLLNNILSAIPSNLNRDEWIAALPRALVAGFVKTDKDFQQKDYVDRGQHSLETITLLLALKIEYPENVHLIRGNHEAADINALFGFRIDCIERMNKSIAECGSLVGDYIKDQVIGYLDQFGTSLPVKVIRNCNRDYNKCSK
ncbi:hypothetical protein AHAS_Ahas10G0112100 [Arachis hypogaea]